MGVTAAVVGAAVVGKKYVEKQAAKAEAAAAAALPDPVQAPIETPATTAEKSKAAETAATAQKKRNTANRASASTILTGPAGLGELEPGQGQKKSLLGY